MPFINIRIVKDAIADDPAGKKVFDEVPAADWYVGKTSVAERRRS